MCKYIVTFRNGEQSWKQMRVFINARALLVHSHSTVPVYRELSSIFKQGKKVRETILVRPRTGTSADADNGFEVNCSLDQMQKPNRCTPGCMYN